MSIKRNEPTTMTTLQNVLERIGDNPDRRQRAMASALRSLGRLACRELATIPADGRAVRALLDEIRPAARHLSVGRWKNICSLVLTAIDQRPAKCSRHPLSAEWATLLAPLPDKPFRIALVPLVRFWSEQGITPHDVDDETFARYQRHLERHSRKSRPRESYLSARRAWNGAAKSYSWWPSFQIEIDNRRKEYSLPWSAFPASLKADVDAMTADALAPDPFAPGAPKRSSPITARGRARSFRALASALVHRGKAPEALRRISDLVTTEAAKDGLRYFIQRLGRRQDPYLTGLACAQIYAVRYWIYRDMTPDDATRADHLEALIRLRNAITSRRRGMTQKNRSLIRRLDDDAMSRLLALPDRVWARYDTSERLKRSDLIKLQVATAIEILTHAPVRRKNLLAIQPDRHLIVVEHRGKKSTHLHFPADELKNEIEIEFELPERTALMFRRYITEVRPRLGIAESPYLFPGTGGGPKCDYMFGDQIAALTEQEVGVRITLHQFRHISGFLILKNNPGAHEVVRRLLGHRSIETTMESYAEMETAAAVRHYDDLIARRRAKPSDQPNATRRKRWG
jgi:integrase